MKKLLILIFAKLFNRFKMKHPAFYGAVVAPFLFWLQTQMFDPEVIAGIQSVADMVPWGGDLLQSILKWLPMLLLAVTGTHTKEVVEEDRQQKRARRALDRANKREAKNHE